MSVLTRRGGAALAVESPRAPDSPAGQSVAMTRVVFHLSDDNLCVLDLTLVTGGGEDQISYWVGRSGPRVPRGEAAVVHGWG